MSEESKGARPTHELKLLDPTTGDRSQVGVAWQRDDHISIKLNVGVVLSYETTRDKHLTLFPARSKEEWDAYHHQRRGNQPVGLPSQRKPHSWKDDHPEYVRKVHSESATRSDCPNKFLGKAKVSNNLKEVTCRKCLKAAKQTQVPKIGGEPNDPPPAA